MLKKAGFITATAAALMMMGGTAAMAADGGGHDWDGGGDHNNGILNDIDILENVNVCGNQVNVIAVPVLNFVSADCDAASVED